MKEHETTFSPDTEVDKNIEMSPAAVRAQELLTSYRGSLDAMSVEDQEHAETITARTLDELKEEIGSALDELAKNNTIAAHGLIGRYVFNCRQLKMPPETSWIGALNDLIGEADARREESGK